MTKRRDVVKALALTPFAALVWTKEEIDVASARVAEFAQTPQTLKFFTPVEWKNIGVLVDDIIPKDERGGSATEAKVPEFMDFILSDGNANNRTNMRAGLDWLEKESQKRFSLSYANATSTDRYKILDDIAWPAKATDAFKAPVTGTLTPVTWFTSVRNLTAGGYFSSRMGYKAVGFSGGVSVPQWKGSSPEIMKKLGLSYDEWDKEIRERILKTPARLGVGFIGSGFNARFHLRAFEGVRDADVLGVWSPNATNAADTAKFARGLGLGDCKAYKSITDMVADKNIHALWLCGPNHARIENVEEICSAIRRKKGQLIGIACEKPLARNVAEATRVASLVKRVGLKTGYLENQLFAPHVEWGRNLIWARGAATTGRPYLARAAEEHSGPHMPWFWRGDLQGGGVLNDMMCHSVEVVRHLLTKPGAPRSSVVPKRVTAHIASLKWSQPKYAKRLKASMGASVDYSKHPAEDFASCMIEFETPDGQTLLGEATTSWSFVGAGLRLSAELLGPEYSMKWNSLDSGLQCFFSREVKGRAGEDLVEKQNAEQGVMPVVPEEWAAYGYEAEDRHFVRVFLGKEKPKLTFEDGVEVVKLLMTAYQSAQLGKTVEFPGKDLDAFIPKVARGTWEP